MGNAKTPTTHFFQEIKVGQFVSVQHYNLSNFTNGKQSVSKQIKIEINRDFAKSSPKFWLKIRGIKKWEYLTGLFYNAKHDLYFGDKGKNNNPEDLIIVKIDNGNEKLILHYFKDYHTLNLDNVIHFIN